MSAVLLPRTPRRRSLGSVFSAMRGGGHHSRTPWCCSPPQAWVWGLFTSCSPSAPVRTSVGNPGFCLRGPSPRCLPMRTEGTWRLSESRCPPVFPAHMLTQASTGPWGHVFVVSTPGAREREAIQQTGKERAGRGALPCQEHQTTSSLLEGRPPMGKGPREKVEGAGQWG